MLQLIRLSDQHRFPVNDSLTIPFATAEFVVRSLAGNSIILTCERSKRTVTVGEAFCIMGEFFALVDDATRCTLLHDNQGRSPISCAHVTESLPTFLRAAAAAFAHHLLHILRCNARSLPRYATQFVTVVSALFALISSLRDESVAQAPERAASVSGSEQLYQIASSIVETSTPTAEETRTSFASRSLPIETTSNEPRKSTPRRICAPPPTPIPDEIRSFLPAAEIKQHTKRVLAARQCYGA